MARKLGLGRITISKGRTLRDTPALHEVNKAVYDRIITQTIRGTNLVPESMFSGLKEAIRLQAGSDNAFTIRKDRRATNLRYVTSEDSKLTEEGLKFVANQAMTVPRYYLGYYLALLDAMTDVLHQPGQFKTGRIGAVSRPTTLSVPSITRATARSSGASPLLRHVLTLTSGTTGTQSWKALRKSTRYQKKKLIRDSQSYWRHTGQLGRAFRKSVNSRKRKMSTKHFLKSIGDPRIIEGGPRTAVGGKKYAHSVRIQMEVGIPTWNPLFDALITTPLSLGKIEGVSHLIPNLPPEEQGDRGSIASFKDFQNRTLRRGVNRAIVPEMTRPWLRRLSYLTHLQMKSDLKRLFR